MCDVIKVRMRGKVEKETSKKEMDNRLFYDVTHDTFRISIIKTLLLILLFSLFCFCDYKKLYNMIACGIKCQ